MREKGGRGGGERVERGLTKVTGAWAAELADCGPVEE